MIHLTDIYFQTVYGGLFDGQAVLVVELGKETEVNALRLIQTIKEFQREYKLKALQVRFVGDYYHQPAEEIDAVLHTLKELGNLTSFVFSGNDRPSWLDRVAYRIVTVSNAPWLGYKTMELRYAPTDDDLQRPEIPEGCSFLYLVPPKEVTETAIMDFLVRNPDFRILVRPMKTFRMKVKLSKED